MRLIKQQGRLWSLAALGAILAVSIAGCGGGTTNGNIDGLATQDTYPFIFSYNGNGGAFTSGIGISSATGAPSATDVSDFTFASSDSAPSKTIAFYGPYETGLQPAEEFGSYTIPAVFPAASPGEAGVVFRAQAVQGETPSNKAPTIVAGATKTFVTSPGGTVTPFQLAYSSGTAAGPFAADSYAASVNLSSITASGVYPFSTTITDSAGQVSTTVFQSVILKPTDAAIAASSAITITGVTPTVSYGPDASGSYVIIVPAGTYTVSVGGTSVGSLTLAGGTVTLE